MNKKIIALGLCGVMSLSLLAGCGGKGESASKTINLWSFTDEVPTMVDKYLETHPDFGYEVKTTIIGTSDGGYQPALDQALAAGGQDAPDIYCVESAFALKYTKGDASQYAVPYKDLGIDVEKGIKDAGIAQYTVDIGSNNDGDVVGLGFQATGGAFIYRRSIAQDVFGTDDSQKVAEAIGPGYDRFFEAAQQVADKGYAMISSNGDLWHAVECSAEQGWVVDGKLNIDPSREEYMDMVKMMYDKGYHNDTVDWSEAWFADMKDAGAKKVFGFFGPAWLINYTIAPNCGGTTEGEGTFGDWAVCDAPSGFFWGGTWLLAGKGSQADPEKQAAIADLLEWITLDTSEDGLQYQWANGTLYGDGTKDVVASSVVMEKSDGSVPFLGGQNMFDVFVRANENATGELLSQYDATINIYWAEQCREYMMGNKSRDQALADFKQQVADNLDVVVE